MKQRHNGSVIRDLIAERNVSITRVSELTGRTRQQVHYDFHRVSLKDDILELYAKALKIPKEDIYERFGAIEGDDSSFGAGVLTDIRRMIEEELKEKNEQIRALQESLKDAQAIIKMAMGKLEPASESSKVKRMYKEQPEAA